MEEELETAELKEKIDEHLEHAEHAEHEAHGHGGGGGKEPPQWTRWLSLSTAMVAVFAAVASLLSGGASNDAILAKSNAMLSEAQAADKWAEYQAQRVKSAIATNQADTIVDTKPDVAGKLRDKAKGYDDKSAETMKSATEQENQVAEANHESEHLMHTHHSFAITVTLLQIAIALAAIGALTKKRNMWFVSLGVSAVGIVFFARGLMLMFG